jgi:calcium/calmodulin-dependent protein kinase I
MVKLANRIEQLKMQEEDPDNSDMPATEAAPAAAAVDAKADAEAGAGEAAAQGSAGAAAGGGAGAKRTLQNTVKGAIFREVVLAKVREMKEQEETLKVTEEASKKV